MESYDVIVAGVGGMGAVTCLDLARRGARVLGIEQHRIGHALGSSHGETRLYRTAYFEAPDYVPLVQRAIALWRNVEAATGRELLVETGLALFGPPGGAAIRGAELAARRHGLAFERPSVDEARGRFPEFRFGDDAEVLFEREAGYLRVEDCVRHAAEAAEASGARLLEETTVTGFASDAGGVRVETRRGAFAASSLVLTAGPWSADLLGSLGNELTVQRQVLLWLAADPEAHGPGSPAFGFDTPEGFFYGFPAQEPAIVKLARHLGGERIERPEAIDRALGPKDREPVLRFVAEHLPRVRPEIVRHHVCMYTMTPDEHFIVDRHPQHRRVFVAAGFSGHGFKFASAVGRALAELALEGKTSEPIGFLSASRFAK